VPTLSKVALVVLGCLMAGALIVGLLQVATSDADEPALADPSTTTSSTSSTSSTTTSSSTTSTTTTPLPPKGTLLIQGTGDVNLDPGYIPALAANGYDYAWEGLDGLFVDDDLTVINLECAPSDLGSPEPKEFVFRCPTDSLGSLAPAGIEVANMGNNHSGDYGKEALVDGRSQLTAVGVAPVGAGANAAEAAAPAVFEVEGWKVAVVGFGGVFPTPAWFATDDQAGMRDGDDIASMVAAVEAAEEVADIVVVAIHWGVELDTKPRPDDVERARAMIAAGADVIFGHHAHRLQSMETIDGAAVFWGLGNFVWPRYSTASATTAVGRVEVRPDGTMDACLIPAFIENSGQPVVTGEPPCGPVR
jgi:poly-gamma-glutamate synthesis protein (capsule biosynthesis protein)